MSMESDQKDVNVRAQASETSDCEDYRDCELPETGIDGETYNCPKCGREWILEDGFFTMVNDQ